MSSYMESVSDTKIITTIIKNFLQHHMVKHTSLSVTFITHHASTMHHISNERNHLL